MYMYVPCSNSSLLFLLSSFHLSSSIQTLFDPLLLSLSSDNSEIISFCIMTFNITREMHSISGMQVYTCTCSYICVVYLSGERTVEKTEAVIILRCPCRDVTIMVWDRTNLSLFLSVKNDKSIIDLVTISQPFLLILTLRTWSICHHFLHISYTCSSDCYHPLPVNVNNDVESIAVLSQFSEAPLSGGDEVLSILWLECSEVSAAVIIMKKHYNLYNVFRWKQKILIMAVNWIFLKISTYTVIALWPVHFHISTFEHTSQSFL